MKQRDTKILIHIAGPLKATTEAFAEAEGMSTSAYVRRLLVDHAVRRVVDEDQRSVIRKICADATDKTEEQQGVAA
jgi:hypothetical protein